MSAELAAFLRAEAARPFEYGGADCVTMVAGWVRTCRGIDPIARERGYSGKAEADRLLAGTNLVRVCGRAARAAGLRMTRYPRPGDVAVIVVAEIAACAIRAERNWVVRVESGLALLPPEAVRVVAAWRV